MKCHCSLLSDLKNGDKNEKAWVNPVSLKKSLKIIGRKLVVSNSNKMQSPLIALKARKTIPAGSVKSENHLRNIKIKCSNRSWQAKN